MSGPQTHSEITLGGGGGSLVLDYVVCHGRVGVIQHPSLQFLMLLPNWIYLISQQTQEGRKEDIFTRTILKIRLWELKEAGTCPKSMSSVG